MRILKEILTGLMHSRTILAGGRERKLSVLRGQFPLSTSHRPRKTVRRKETPSQGE